MTESDKYREFILCEAMKLDLDKWFEGCNRHEDPGPKYINEWIMANAAKFRETWFNSNCCTCAQWEQCGWKALLECESYKKNF